MKSQVKFRAFSLIELMVAMSITVLLVTLLVTIANSTTKAWKHGEGSAETFSQARGALSLIGRELQGAVIDLDLGYAIQPVDGQPNNFVLKFLSRRAPKGKDVAAVEKVAYQMAWASRGLLPEVTNNYDTEHPIPVLIRTSNSDPERGLYDVFDAETNSASYWVRNWPEENWPIQTGKPDTSTGDVTEVVAENVLGWRVNPIYWLPENTGGTDEVRGKVEMDDPNLPNSRYFDLVRFNSPKYITSDLKYVKSADDEMENEPAESAPRAIAIRMAVVPTNAVTRLKDFSDWANVQADEDLFKPVSEFTSSPFNNVLKTDVRFFDGTYFLSSKTP
jgi:hypothetical protein